MVTIKEPFHIRILQGIDGGKSLGITLPKEWVGSMGLEKGDKIILNRNSDEIVIKKLLVC